MSINSPDPTGSLEVALSHATRLLGTDPRLAAEQAAEILKVIPGEPRGWLLLGRAQRDSGDAAAAAATLQELCAVHPQWGLAHQELGLALGAAGDGAGAIVALQRAVELKPDLGDAWRALGDHLHALDDADGADQAYANYLKATSKDPRLMAAAAALCDKRIAVAETLLREHLTEFPTDVAAIRMLAEVAGRLGRNEAAEKLLERCLELAPSFRPARYNYALVLNRQYKLAEAQAQIEQLLAANPSNPAYNNLYAVIVSRLGEYQKAIQVYEKVLRQYPAYPGVWLSYGHTLKTGGSQDDGIAAYREAIRLAPNLGEAWWSLANLKTFRFTDTEIEAMEAQLLRQDISDEDRFHFHFALGKAFEDAGRYEEAFHHYDHGNRLRRSGLRYDPDETTGHVRRSCALFTPAFFAERSGYGVADADPIFIVGLPRAGSTLLEQILASHSAVEGTMELPDIISIAKELRLRASKGGGDGYPEILASLTAEECHALGQRYLDQTRVQRKTGRPFFIDKMPNNFMHIGLIHLALPNARIIDARRHPLGCCFSMFKQHFARGQNFTYSLEDIGHYYRDYVELMAHFDAVLPGRIYRVFYERMIEDTEGEIRRLLAYCNVPFEQGCLRFFETERAVRTASSEQVRRPIYREGVDQWRHFEPWLAPLREALGEVLDAYPEVPAT